MNAGVRHFLHLSDMHFGRHSVHALSALRQFIHERRTEIDRILITGDFTQRAKNHQFSQASEFLREVGLPVVATPGNHDVPLFDFWNRLRSPYKRYEVHMNDLVDHEYQDKDVLILSVRTTNVWTIHHGYFSQKEADRVRHQFESGSGKLKMLLLHHPLEDSTKRQKQFLRTIMSAGVNMVLSGHGHQSSATQTEIEGRSVLMCSAGTAISDRLREEKNSFNMLSVGPRYTDFTVYTLSPGSHIFEKQNEQRFSLQ